MAAPLITPEQFKQKSAEVMSAFSTFADNGQTSEVIRLGIKALEKIMSLLADEIDYKGQKPCEECGRKGMSAEQAGKTAAYVCKTVLETTQVLEKAQTAQRLRAEQRGNLSDLLQYLTPEQFKIVDGWISENKVQ